MALPIIGLVFSVTFLTITTYVVYQVWFHPLSRYPGPFLAKFTTIYAGYHGWRGDIAIDIWRCHQRYGDRIRYGPSSLLINSAQAHQAIYGFNSNVLKSPVYHILAKQAPSILTLRDPKEHRRRRQVISAALADGQMLFQEPKLLEHIDSFCTQMEKLRPDVSTDMAPWCNYLLFDMTMSMVFGKESKLLTDSTYRHIPGAIHQSSILQGVLVQDLSVAILGLHRWLFKHCIQERQKFVRFIRSIIGARMENTHYAPGEGRDVFSFLEHSNSRSCILSPHEIRAECATLIIAGSDTSAMGLAGTLFYLSRYRSAYKVAAEEVREKFKSPSEIRLGPLLSSCTYLKACIQESMRLSPPVGAVPWRTVEAADGTMVDGCHLPRGTQIGVGIYSIHHKPEHFADPFTFRPERWLADSRPSHFRHELNAYGPFSIGPRSCVGKGVAMHELMLTMAHVLLRLEFEAVTPEGEQVVVVGPVPKAVPGTTEYLMTEHITAVGDGPLLRFRRRKHTLG